MLLFKAKNFYNLFLINLILLLSLQLVSEVKARFKRCFVCRSRGPLGDCKDTFEFNSTTVAQTGVEAQPCASGWCGKSTEGKDDGEGLMATERMCLQRPPSDNKERCADTFYGNKKKTFFMCFCKGDLCNAGSKLNHSFQLMFSSFLIVLFNMCNNFYKFFID